MVKRIVINGENRKVLKMYRQGKQDLWILGNLKLWLPNKMDKKQRNIIADELKIKKELFGKYR